MEIKEIQAGLYKQALFHRHLPIFVTNKLPTSETLAVQYILLDSLLFKITPEKETAVLAVPEVCADKGITLFHSSLFAGHQGVIQTYLTVSDKFFIPNLIHYLRSYIKGCHICQLVCNEKPNTRQLQTRTNPNYIPLSRLSMDLKVKSCLDHIEDINSFLCIIDEVTNYLIAVPIHQANLRKEEKHL